MTSADDMALAEIRKLAGDEIPEAVWDVVRNQVAEVGVRGLTGTARALVEGLVRKHGSHDQSSHGRGGKSQPTVRQIQSAATFLDNEGDVPSEQFAPTGIGSMSMDNAKRMIAHAKKLGWKED